jgi:YD repeat-containing protein
MRRRAPGLLVVAFVIAAGPLFAQQPNLDRGFSADKIYDFVGLDSVNQFNGNMILRIPLGQEYESNGALGYQFALSYNSSVWDYVFDDTNPDGTQLRALPSKKSNAGMGWLLTLGLLLPPGNSTDAVNNPGNDSNSYWAYIGPDGSQHLFYDTLHGESSDGIHWYTRDSTYLRQTIGSDGFTRTIEFPDGTRRVFKKYTTGTATWLASTTGTKWRLSSIEDGFGNTVAIRYETRVAVADDPAYPEIWHVVDGSREHVVYFVDGTPYYSLKLHHVVLQAFNGAAARYDMTYDDSVNFSVSSAGDTTTLNRKAWLLRSVTVPDNTTYQMTDYDSGSTSGAPGGLTRLMLPTQGEIRWSYAPFDDRPGWVKPHSNSPTPIPPVVYTRALDGPGVTSGTWTYGRAGVSSGQSCSCRTGTCYEGERQLSAWVNQPDGTSKLSYFTIASAGDPCPLTGWILNDYGLPFIRLTSSGNGYLSTQLRSTAVVGSPPWGGYGTPTGDTLAQSEYVRYEYETANTATYNSRVNYARTKFEDDTLCSGCFRETTFSGFDGYGHFRQAVTSSDVAGQLVVNGANRTPYRTVFTNYPGTLDGSGDWVLNTPSETCVADESSARTELLTACSALPGAETTALQYDRATGALLGRRILAGSNAATTAQDLLALFTFDSKGNLSKEQYFGGDVNALPDPPNGLFAPGSAVADYTMTRTLTYDGTGTLWKRKSTYDGIAAPIEDIELDMSTRAVALSRDSAGFATQFTYDLMGRLTNIAPPAGLASTTIDYTNASASQSALATATTTSSTSGTVKHTYEFDALGRVWHDKTLMPDSSTSQVETLYNSMGRVASVSTRQNVSSFTASDKTSYTYDVTGKAKQITAPDGNTTTIDRRAAGQVKTTVATAGPDGSIVRTETYDGLGRLYTVTENSGSTSVTQLTGTATTTSYQYDRADRLTSVTIAGSQSRSFDYDLRGFLTSEFHPESGTTSYGTYDSRGHAHHKRNGAVGGVFDLMFDYDAAERLTRVTDQGSTRRALKDFAYSDSGNSAGKLSTATRYNHLSVGDVKVTETYSYGGSCCPAGSLASKSTAVDVAGTSFQTFSQSYAYDDLAEAKSLTYPTCTGCSTTGGIGTLTRTFTNGSLMAVGSYGSLTYHPNGMIKDVTHPGSVVDTYELDAHSMPRPKSITFSGYKTASCPSTVTVTPDAASICVNGHAHATVTAVSGASYSWTIDGGTIEAGGTTQTVTFTSATAGTVVLHATVAVSGCTSVSNQASVPVLASASIQSGDPIDPPPITPGTTATLRVTATGTNLHYHWYRGTYPSGTPVGADSATYVTEVLSVTTTYWVHVDSDCGAVDSRTATVTVLAGSCPSSITVTPDAASICVNGHAHATVTAVSGASYSWTIDGGTIEAGGTTQTVTFTSATAGTVVLHATVTVSGCTPVSNQASVPVRASASIQSGDPVDPAPIAPGTTATLHVTATGTNLHYHWYRGAYPSGTPVGADSATYVTDVLSVTTTYWVHVDSDCGSGDSRTATVTVLAAPSSVQATTESDATRVLISWNSVSNAGSYVVQYASSVNGTFGDLGPPTSGLTAEHVLSSNAPLAAYVYRVVSLDSSGRRSPANSPMDYAVTGAGLFSQPIQIGITTIRAAHIVELRNAIDELRRASGQSMVWAGAPPPSGLITATPITDLFAPFNAARSVYGLPNFAYSAGTPLPDHNVTILARHIQEVRDALR